MWYTVHVGPPNLKAMKAGRRRAQRARDAESVTRVREYRRWLRRGSPLREIPPIPTDHDYAVAERRGLKR